MVADRHVLGRDTVEIWSRKVMACTEQGPSLEATGNAASCAQHDVAD
jgi:hypothetical protein